MKLYLIGGPGDRRTYDVSDSMNHHIRFREYPKVPYHEVTCLGDLEQDFIYRIEKLAGRNSVFRLGVPEKMPIDAALEMLLEGYATGS